MKFPIVYIRWVDPWSIDEWISIEDVEDDAPLICTVGFLIKSTMKSHVVALNFNPDSDEISCCMIIPRDAVRKLEHVKRCRSDNDDTSV